MTLSSLQRVLLFVLTISIGSRCEGQASVSDESAAATKIRWLGGVLIRARLSDEYSIVGVNLKHSSRMAEHHLAVLRDLPELREVSINQCSLTAMGMASLGELNGLKCLTLVHCAITDDALVELGKMVQLSSLGLTSIEFTDTTIESLASLKDLMTLKLIDCDLRPHDIRRLSGLSKLVSVEIHGSPISVDDARSLALMQSLTRLDLSERISRTPRSRNSADWNRSNLSI